MVLRSGTRLGSYEITSLLGSGGMGEVYRAKDLKLGRDVAIKVLREELATDPERLRRFEQEARSASALNHPNIITIYDIHLRQGHIGQVGKEADVDYIVMEFVEGKTLREILAEGPLTTKKLLQLATQIAEGLAKAHSAGIVHRDLKPENLMVTADGFVKILDFGLAKLVPEHYGFDSERVTLTKTGTREGVLLGTVQYMSPEQAACKTVNYHSDQFALGSILYEMATGKLPFKRETIPQTLAAIIEDEPAPIVRAEANLPEHFRAIVERSLAKDPGERYDSTRDLARDLEGIRDRLLASRQREPVEKKPKPSKDQRQRRSRIRSLVVLPLANLSADPEQEYFADGMTEALITDLAKISALKVISRTSAMRYKGLEKPLPEIARELAVDGVVEGSVLRAGQRVRITAQLIRAATDEHLWAESYERDLRDILSLQSEVAQAVAREIKIKLSPRERNRIASTCPVNPEAHEAYLMGRYHFGKYSPDAFEKAVRFYHVALEKDPNYGLAYAALANAYGGHGYWGFISPREINPKALAAAQKAAAMGVGEAHGASGAGRAWNSWEWSAAEKELRRAVELYPSDTDARLSYAILLGSMRRLREGMKEAKGALELDPLNLAAHSIVGWHFYASHQYELAIERYKKGLEVDPNFFILHWYLWRAFRQVGRFEEAMAECRTMLSLRGNNEAIGPMERGYAQSGYQGAMLGAARKLAEQYPHAYFPPSDIAILFNHADELDEALHWLEKGTEERDPRLHTIGVDPDWDNMRADLRFLNVLRRMDLPE